MSYRLNPLALTLALSSVLVGNVGCGTDDSAQKCNDLKGMLQSCYPSAQVDMNAQCSGENLDHYDDFMRLECHLVNPGKADLNFGGALTTGLGAFASSLIANLMPDGTTYQWQMGGTSQKTPEAAPDLMSCVNKCTGWDGDKKRVCMTMYASYGVTCGEAVAVVPNTTVPQATAASQVAPVQTQTTNQAASGDITVEACNAYLPYCKDWGQNEVAACASLGVTCNPTSTGSTIEQQSSGTPVATQQVQTNGNPTWQNPQAVTPTTQPASVPQNSQLDANACKDTSRCCQINTEQMRQSLCIANGLEQDFLQCIWAAGCAN